MRARRPGLTEFACRVDRRTLAAAATRFATRATLTLFATAGLACLVPACSREVLPKGPKRLLQLAAAPLAAEASPSIVVLDAFGRAKRQALTASAGFRLPVPKQALLVFSLGAPSANEEEARGFFHLEVRLDGQKVGERHINVRTERGCRASSLSFDGPGRAAELELDLSLRAGTGEPRSLPPGLTLWPTLCSSTEGPWPSAEASCSSPSTPCAANVGL